MPRSVVALAVSRETPSLVGGESALPAALAREGLGAAIVPWDAEVDWRGYGAVLLRQTWDYFHRPAAFLDWLGRLPVTVYNDRSAVEWNLEKSYLKRLAERGVKQLPTEWVAHEGPDSLIERVRRLSWPLAVAKPVLSAGAFRTVVLDPAGPAPDTSDWPAGMGLMLQPFTTAIQGEGEWSLVYFDGSLSHAVIKRPAAGDFRVQAHHGGRTEAARPPADVVAAAERCLAALDVPWLYARVDLVREGGEPLLMELELIEPYLYLEHDEESPARLARAIAKRL